MIKNFRKVFAVSEIYFFGGGGEGGRGVIVGLRVILLRGGVT